MSRDAERPGTWTVDPEAAGERLDLALAERLGVPRSRVRSWIGQGRVWIAEAVPRKSGTVLRSGDTVRWDPPPMIDDRIVAEPGPLNVLWTDDDLLVLDKPADLVVHPGAGRRTGTLAHRLLAAYPELAGVGGPGRPGIVHRLDRGTTGCLLVARNRRTHEALARAFAAREIDKRYLAIVWGKPRGDSGAIDAPIGRHPTERKKMAVRPRGRPALTRWRVLDAAGPVALLELDLETGRTHQIRVHARYVGHPLVGDAVYGEARHRALPASVRKALAEFPRPALHAWKLAFDHPVTGRRIACEATVPADLRALWRDAAGRPLLDL